MKQVLGHHKLWSAAALLAADCLFFSFTSPQKVASWFLIVGVLLFIISLYYLFVCLLHLARWYGLPSGKRPQRLAKLVVGLLGSLVALQSIGELSSRDVLVLLPLGFIAYLYSYRALNRSELS